MYQTGPRLEWPCLEYQIEYVVLEGKGPEKEQFPEQYNGDISFYEIPACLVKITDWLKALWQVFTPTAQALEK